MARSTVLTAGAAGLLVAGGIGGFMLFNEHRKSSDLDDGARTAATGLASAWQNRELDQAPYIGTSPTAAAANWRTATAALGPGPITVAVGEVNRDGKTAKANLNITWKLRNGQTFAWTDPVNLVMSGDTWGVKVGDTSLWHPKLTASGSMSVQEANADRGEILGRGGAKIMSNQTVYDVGLDPLKATDASASQVEGAVGSDPGSLVRKLNAAKTIKSEAIISVITYRESDYSSRKGSFDGVPGVVVTPRKQPLAQTRTFGQPMLGTVAQVSAEMIKKDPNKYHAGMYAGTSGLQAQYDDSLRPSGGLTVSVKGTGETLFGTKSAPGKSLQTTLDPKVQAAAEKALTKTGAIPSALVAIDVKTGDVLAVANSPANGINRAVSGRYQPGSTLKVSTTYALLTKGFNPDTVVPCPPSIVVDGRRIGNFEQETLTNPKFSDNFAHSCNTAFVQASKDLGDDDMKNAAHALGIGVDWSQQLGVRSAYTGSVPTTNGRTDKAAASFGQARTLASPMSIAVMSASIARGNYIPPTLVAGQGGDRTPKPLNGAAVQQIQGMMRKVVTEGSGTVMQGTPGGDVYAKTGTAEFTGEGGKPLVRAWLTGWQGDVAFAVLVEEVQRGQTGGTVAAPVAKEFFTNLNAG